MQEPNNQLKSVSYIVPCYNHGKYINDCIKSILEQDYPDKIIVVVDNGSSDNSFELIVDEFKKLGEINKAVMNTTEFVTTTKDKTLLLATTFQNRIGAAGARNVGIAATFNIAEYFLFIDADDYLNIDTITSKMVNIFNNYPEVGLIYGDYQILNEETKNIWTELKETYSLEGLQRDCFINSPLIRKSVIEQIGMFDQELDGQEDYDMWIRIGEKYMCYHIPDPVLTARQTELSTYNRVSPAKYQAGLQRISQKIQARRSG